jgi:class 3 adenylate cyclase
VSQLIEPLDAARNAAERQSWRETYDAYTSADRAELTPADLERFADSAWWTGRLDDAIALRERSYAAYGDAGDKLGAARLALTLTWDYLGRGAYAVSEGWFAKAERLLEGLPESVEHAHKSFFRGFTTLLMGADVDSAAADFEHAYELGQRLGDRDLQAMALTGKGKLAVLTGEVDKGLKLLDEATAAAMAGELNPSATGLVYCCTISSCQELGDYRRAAEWTDAANRWCDGLDVSGPPGECRVHRAQIMRFRGDWPKAEAQAIAACEELHDYNRFVTSAGFYEIGEIRRRRGDFAAADTAYRQADEWGKIPQPGLALLRLAEGRVESAVSGITRSLEEVEEPLSRAQQLPAQVEIALAAGDVKTARSAADELERIVDAYMIGSRRAPAFDATVHLARGQIALFEGELDTAARSLRKARDEWKQISAPYETAQARMLLGIAYRRQRDEDAAVAEFQAALARFEKLGAKLDEERVKELLGGEARRTFLFTDIVDSTKLLGTLGDDKWKKLLARHNELVRQRIADTGGEVIKQTGDGFFASFGSPKSAIEAAVAIQRALHDEIVAPDVRIGVHTGGAFHTGGGDATDYGGQGVHTAARIGAAAGAAEILVSNETLDGIGTAFRLSEPRTQELKGLEQPVEVVSVAWR